VFVGDWDGDGVDTLALRRGNRFSFANENVTGAALEHAFFGAAGDEVLVGDFDADGRDTLTIRRTTQFLVANELGGPVDARFFFGAMTDAALAGNFDGN